MTAPTIFHDGEEITIEADNRIVPGHIIKASPNGVSLLIEFEALLFGYAGAMPVLHDGHAYRDLMTGSELKITRKAN